MKPTTPLLTPNTGPLKPTTPLRPKNAPQSPISHPQRRWRFQSHAGTSEQRRWRFQLRLSLREQRRQGFHTTGPPGLQGLTAIPTGDDDTTASQISHAIRLEEVSTMSENVAIPTLLIHSSKESRGNCMRNWGSSAMMWILINTTHPTGAEGAGGPVGTAAVPVGGGGAWPGFETTRRAKLAARTARGRAAAHRHTQQPGPQDSTPDARNTSGTTTTNTKSGPEPLGSGPPSMLSGDQQCTTRISSARPPCHPCRSSRR